MTELFFENGDVEIQASKGQNPTGFSDLPGRNSVPVAPLDRFSAWVDRKPGWITALEDWVLPSLTEIKAQDWSDVRFLQESPADTNGVRLCYDNSV